LWGSGDAVASAEPPLRSLVDGEGRSGDPAARQKKKHGTRPHQVTLSAGRATERMRKSLATMGFISTLLTLLGIGAQPAAAADAKPVLTSPPEVTSETEEGFHDLLLLIEKHKVLPDGGQSLRVSGIHRGKRVALEIVLGSAWRAGSLKKDVPLTTYQGRITYRSVGPESDVLLRTLDDLYGTILSASAMAKETHFTCITLGGDPRELGKGRVDAKLFYEAEAEEDYAELFTNIDLAAKRVEIREKDQDYRSPIVRALRAKPAG
jgi:hypothetical protein